MCTYVTLKLQPCFDRKDHPPSKKKSVLRIEFKRGRETLEKVKVKLQQLQLQQQHQQPLQLQQQKNTTTTATVTATGLHI